MNVAEDCINCKSVAASLSVRSSDKQSDESPLYVWASRVISVSIRLAIVQPGCRDFKVTWAPSQYENIFPRYGDSHVKDKTVARRSYL